MRWRIVAVGKPKLSFARDAVAEYLTRIRCFTTAEMEVVKTSTPEKEGKQLLELSEGCYRIILDERGKSFRSMDLANTLERIEMGPHKSCALLVGGADGHTAEVRKAADLLWSLSPLTMQHEMALFFALEQIYRAFTIRAKLPYHRE